MCEKLLDFNLIQGGIKMLISNIITYVVSKKIAFMWLILASLYLTVAYKKIKK